MRMTPITKWGSVVLFWLGWSVAVATFSFSWRAAINMPVEWTALAPLYFAAYAVWAIFTPLVVWLSKRFPFEKGRWSRTIPIHVCLAPCVSILHALITTSLNPWIWPTMTTSEPLLHSVQRNFLMMGSDDIFIYWSITFVVQGWMYYQRYRDRELRNSVLETQLAKAQLQALKVQLHPHFLFNTLNSVSELMHQDVRSAERVITRLSDLLRMTLENIGAQEVTLREEVDFVRGYLEIEQTRFQDRLKVDYQIASETLDARVPNLMLQPLVENAIRHGIAKSSQAGLILIQSELHGTRITIRIRDNGPGIRSNGNSGGNFGIGLSTTRARLEFLYGRDHSLELNNLPEGGLEVRLVIPFHSAGATAEVSSRPLTVSEQPRPILEGVRS
jgi:two-component system, LytTR family, sensor kinase